MTLHPDLPPPANALEATFRRLRTPFEQFVHDESAGGLVLLAAAVLALVLANSALHAAYHHFFEQTLTLAVGGFTLAKSLHHWINDGLMALFFLLVGLEIKRELLYGELASLDRAILPAVAAVGGVVAPALIYAGINAGGPGIDGWAIPMATDIAFAVGILALLAGRVPLPLVSFLVALAIVDDLIAVIVIALFYTAKLNLTALAAAFVVWGVMWVLNLANVRGNTPYLLLGLVLWVLMPKAGVHATLAGVMTALTIPASSRHQALDFSAAARRLLDLFDRRVDPDPHRIVDDEQKAVLHALSETVRMTKSPLQRLEHRLHLPVAFAIVPVFAFANAGVALPFAELVSALVQPVPLGIILGLVVGKPLGITLAVWLAVRSGLARLPAGVTMTHIIGAGMLAGIGFTMSIFIAELSFVGDPALLTAAKTGILAASLIAGVVGFTVLARLGMPQPASPSESH